MVDGSSVGSPRTCGKRISPLFPKTNPSCLITKEAQTCVLETCWWHNTIFSQDKRVHAGNRDEHVWLFTSFLISPTLDPVRTMKDFRPLLNNSGLTPHRNHRLALSSGKSSYQNFSLLGDAAINEISNNKSSQHFLALHCSCSIIKTLGAYKLCHNY